MNDTLFIIIAFLIIYLIGVFVSMVSVAYINRYREEIPEIISILSWFFVVGTFVVLPAVILILKPFEKLQRYLNKKFKRS